jgi:hypothetical protein
MEAFMNGDSKVSNTIIALAAVGGAVTGVFSFIAALFPFFAGDFTGAGLCLLASAFSFGLLANALYRA